LTNGRNFFNGKHEGAERDVVTKAIVDLRRASGAEPEVMVGALIDAAWSCQDDDQRRKYENEARRIAATMPSANARRVVFQATR
jgi:hypothetical protein